MKIADLDFFNIYVGKNGKSWQLDCKDSKTRTLVFKEVTSIAYDGWRSYGEKVTIKYKDLKDFLR